MVDEIPMDPVTRYAIITAEVDPVIRQVTVLSRLRDCLSDIELV
jgi:hypothetical protein